MVDELPFRLRRSFCGHDKGLHCFSVMTIRHAHHHRFVHRRVLKENFFPTSRGYTVSPMV